MSKAPAQDEDASVMFYDYDYPWPEDPFFSYIKPGKIGYDSTANDIAFLQKGAAANESKNVLDLCCGTGRLSIPHAREGRNVTGVDLSQGQIDRAHHRLQKEPRDVQQRTKFVTSNVVGLDLDETFDFVQIGFNSFAMIADPQAQQETVMTMARHMKSGSLGVIDINNPLRVKPDIDFIPTVMYERTSSEHDFRYTKTGWVTEVDTYQKITESGWYDVIAPDGSVKRYPYTMVIRHPSMLEVELMVERAGLKIGNTCGNHYGADFTVHSAKMIFIVVKP
ncbi:MAG: methyltransferase domain-containing protein [Pseudomonadota bacterium]